MAVLNIKNRTAYHVNRNDTTNVKTYTKIINVGLLFFRRNNATKTKIVRREIEFPKFFGNQNSGRPLATETPRRFTYDGS